jgi:replicative DNA helicase
MSAYPATSSPAPAVSVSTPQRVEIAERALLGRLLKLGTAGKAQADYERVSDLAPESFSKKSHSIIWQAMQAIATRQENINITTVENEMRKILGRDLIGEGATYLEDLMKGQQGDVGDSAKIIREDAWQRASERYAGEMVKTLQNDKLTIPQKVERLNTLNEKIIRESIAVTGETGITLHDSIALMRDRLQAQMDARADGEIIGFGVMTGLRAIDEWTNGFQRGEVTVFAGPTGMGKSALAVKIAKHAMQDGNRVCFVPLEMKPLEMTQRLMAIETQINGMAIKTADIPIPDRPRFLEACNRIQGYKESHQFRFLEMEPQPNINQLIVSLNQHMLLYGAELIIIDQVSIEAMSGTHPAMHESQVLREIMMGLKKFAETKNVPIVVMAQLNRAGSGQDGQRPTINNLAHSSSVANAANAVILLYRPNVQNQQAIEPIEFIFVKNRGGDKGIKEALFIPAFTDYVDKA